MVVMDGPVVSLLAATHVGGVGSSDEGEQYNASAVFSTDEWWIDPAHGLLKVDT